MRLIFKDVLGMFLVDTEKGAVEEVDTNFYNIDVSELPMEDNSRVFSCNEVTVKIWYSSVEENGKIYLQRFIYMNGRLFVHKVPFSFSTIHELKHWVDNLLENLLKMNSMVSEKEEARVVLY